MKAIIPILALFFSATYVAQAEQFGLFTYEISESKITITDYPEDASGHVEIPSEIEGLPVTVIGHTAFNNCTGVTSIIIPNRVTSINRSWNSATGHAFSGCSSLDAIEIAPGNASYVSNDGVVFDKAKTMLILYPPGKAGDYLIPEGVLRFVDDIGDVEGRSAAFDGCSLLTTLTLPASFSYFVPGGFTGCNSLQTIKVKEANPRFTSVDGVLFNKEMTELLRYPPGKIGSYRVPDSVTEIDRHAFNGCTGLTTVSIPDGVIIINDSLSSPFSGCSGLTAIDVDPLNPNYSSLDGVFFDKNKTTLIQYPAAKSGGFEIPDSVTSIHSLRSEWEDHFWASFYGHGAFEGSDQLTNVRLPEGINRIGSETFKNCAALTTVTIPAKVTFIGDTGNARGCAPDWCSSTPPPGAFEDCTNLQSAIFLGDAPTTFDEATFNNTASDFTIYYLSSSTGFTSPTWNGYSTVMLDESTYPAAPWLVSHGLSQDTNLSQDLNNDGVSLLMAYALNLDPNATLNKQMPAPVLTGNKLTLTFHAAAPGITYTPQTSTDLQTWTTNGGTLSDLDLTKHRTASVPLDASHRYLRLVVAESPRPQRKG